MSAVNPRRTIDELKDLRARTGDANGAQRVAFTDVWREARAWLRPKLAALPVGTHMAPAGNPWSTQTGEPRPATPRGRHMDPVAN